MTYGNLFRVTRIRPKMAVVLIVGLISLYSHEWWMVIQRLITVLVNNEVVSHLGCLHTLVWANNTRGPTRYNSVRDPSVFLDFEWKADTDAHDGDHTLLLFLIP